MVKGEGLFNLTTNVDNGKVNVVFQLRKEGKVSISMLPLTSTLPISEMRVNGSDLMVSISIQIINALKLLVR